jgi:DNA-directed RNA polymerase beta' subunit
MSASAMERRADEVEFMKSIKTPEFWSAEKPEDIPLPQVPIARVSFGLRRLIDLEAESVGEVTTATLHERGLPRESGLLDLRGGTCDRTLLCQTCSNNSRICTGHLMLYRLPMPVINVSFLPFVTKVLRTICFGCMRLRCKDASLTPLLHAKDASFWTKNVQLRNLSAYIKGRRRCEHCSCVLPVISVDKLCISWAWTSRDLVEIADMLRSDPGNPHIFVPPDIDLPELVPVGVDAKGKKLKPRALGLKGTKRVKVIIDTQFIRDTLMAVDQADFAKIGIDSESSHPADAIISALPVPPLAMRPTVHFSSSTRHRRVSDLTMRLQEIVRSGEKLRTLMKEQKESDGDVGESGDDDESLRKDDCLLQLKPPPPLLSMIPEEDEPEEAKEPDSKKRKVRRSRAMGIRHATRKVRAERSRRTPKQKLMTSYSDLCVAVCMYIDCDSRVAKTIRKSRSRMGAGNGGVQQSVIKKLRGKSGRVRDNLAGRRVTQSARTVACPTKSLGMAQIGVAEHISLTLTDEEPVQDYNIQQMRTRIVLGALDLDGAKSVIRNGKRADLSLMDRGQREALARRLRNNDVIERPLKEGQQILHGRQPTLHRGSMMSHSAHRNRADHQGGKKLKVTQINNSVTSASNCDFDGDATNLYLPGGFEARAEMENLMRVAHRLRSTNHRTLMAMIQDSLVAGWRLTPVEGVVVDRALYMQALAQGKNVTFEDIDRAMSFAEGTEEDPYYGHHLVSALLPATFCYEQTTMSLADGSPQQIEVTRGMLIRGRLCKKTLGCSANGMISAMAALNGSERTLQFLDDAQRVWGMWMSQRALSISPEDLLISAEAEAEVARCVDDAVRKADSAARRGVSEQKIVQRLQNVVMQAGTIALRAAKMSGFVEIVSSGAKGSTVNLAQVLCCIGQQTIGGARFGNSYERTLPNFPRKRKWQSAATRGFIKSAFINGLTPSEMYAHLAGSRNALIDTVRTTSRCGYSQRKMKNQMENDIVQYDGSVRGTNGQIVAYGYGTDGMDGAQLEPVNLPGAGAWSRSVIAPRGTTTVFLPFHAIKRAKLLSLNSPPSQLPVDRGEIAAALDMSMGKLIASLQEHRRLHPGINISAILDHLNASRNEIVSILPTVQSAHELCQSFDELYFKALVHPGEAVGTLSSDSCGELITQMILNVFHFAGMTSIASTQGVPRLCELLDASTSIRTPCMSVWGENLEELAPKLPCRMLDHIISEAHILYQPDIYSMEGHGDQLFGLHPQVRKDQNSIVGCTAFLRDALEPTYRSEDASGWVLLLLLDSDELKGMRLTALSLADRVRKYLGVKPKQSERYLLEASVAAMHTPCIRIRITNSSDINEACGEDLIKRFPGWSQERRDRAHSELFHSLTHSLRHTLAFGIRLGGVDKITAAEVGVPNDRLGLTPDEPRILTAGSSVREVWMLPGIDWKRILTNDVHETVKTFGIEAGTALLFHELRSVMCSGGSSVADRHLLLLASSMTCSGRFTALTRFEQGRKRRGPLVRASFEQQVASFVDGASFAESDPVRFFAEALMVGTSPPAGTGIVKLTIDPKYLEYARKIHAKKVDILKRAKEKGGGKRCVRACLHTDAKARQALQNDQEVQASLKMSRNDDFDMQWMQRRGMNRRRRRPPGSMSSMAVEGAERISAAGSNVPKSDYLDFESARAYTLVPEEVASSGGVMNTHGTMPVQILDPAVIHRLVDFQPSEPVLVTPIVDTVEINRLLQSLVNTQVVEAPPSPQPSPPPQESLSTLLNNLSQSGVAPEPTRPVSASQIETLFASLSASPVATSPLYDNAGTLQIIPFNDLLNRIL